MTSQKQNFKKDFEELEKIIEAFEAGAVDLEEGIKLFERGLTLASKLKKQLDTFENKVEIIKKKFSDNREET